jgi:hypothetical protein
MRSPDCAWSRTTQQPAVVQSGRIVSNPTGGRDDELAVVGPAALDVRLHAVVVVVGVKDELGPLRRARVRLPGDDQILVLARGDRPRLCQGRHPAHGQLDRRDVALPARGQGELVARLEQRGQQRLGGVVVELVRLEHQGRIGAFDADGADVDVPGERPADAPGRAERLALARRIAERRLRREERALPFAQLLLERGGQGHVVISPVELAVLGRRREIERGVDRRRTTGAGSRIGLVRRRVHLTLRGVDIAAVVRLVTRPASGRRSS